MLCFIFNFVMSTLRYAYSLLKDLLDDLEKLTEEDLEWQNMKPIPDNKRAYKLMSTLYVKYILVTNSFTKLMNMIVNYHKREKLKPLVSNLLSRIIELKAEMAKMASTDIPYLDDVLMEMGVSRRSIEINIPDYYRFERAFVVKEFFRFTEKIKDGLVLKQFPKKPVPELALDLRKYYMEDMKLGEIVEGEKEGRRIEKKHAEDTRRALNKARGLPDRMSSPIKRPPKFTSHTGRGEIKRVIQLMGMKREKVYNAMRTVMKQPLDEPYESWKFPFARDVVRAPYFQGKNYFFGFEKLVDLFEYGKFVAAIVLLQKHERARRAGIYYMIMKERHEKIFTILMNRRKGLKTVLKSKEDFRYPITFRDYTAMLKHNTIDTPHTIQQLNTILQVFGLHPGPTSSPEFCIKYHQYKSDMRKVIQQAFEELIKVEALSQQELSRVGNLNELDIIGEILEYFIAWHQESKPLAIKYGWDLMEIPNPDKKVLAPPEIVVGIPKSLTDAYVAQNFAKLLDVPQRPPPLSGTALIVTGNHITKEQFMAVKPLALARQTMPKEAKEAEAKKQKPEKDKQEGKNKKNEEKGYAPQKSQIPLFVMRRCNDLHLAREYEQVEALPLISPKLIEESEVKWKIANTLHLQTRHDVDKKMVIFQKEVRAKTIKKHRKAENLKKRNIPAIKKPKKEWALNVQEKWDITYALAKDGYFRNYYNDVMENMPGAHFFSFSNYELIEETFTEPDPAWGDLYQLAKLWCIFPLVDLNVRQFGPLVSAIGFAGPRDVVNRLVCTVAHQSGALLICIDPTLPEGDVPLNQLANMILKIAKSGQPTIVLVDNCHILYKKGPAEKPLLLKAIQKIKKGINRKFKILMIGATDKPEIVNGKKMSKVFDKIIPFPYKDYHTSADYWGNYLFRNASLSKDFPYPALVEPVKSYKIPQITHLFSENVLTSHRKKELVVEPLKISEFFNSLHVAKAMEGTSDNIKIQPSAYAWATGQYKSFKARKKMLKQLLDERMELLNPGKDKKKK